MHEKGRISGKLPIIKHIKHCILSSTLGLGCLLQKIPMIDHKSEKDNRALFIFLAVLS